eukprot:scaffold3998_cov153-Skeletonema_dohrnii-CCMP3373.AAC.20
MLLYDDICDSDDDPPRPCDWPAKENCKYLQPTNSLGICSRRTEHYEARSNLKNAQERSQHHQDAIGANLQFALWCDSNVSFYTKATSHRKTSHHK